MFFVSNRSVFLVQSTAELSEEDISKLEWLLNASSSSETNLDGHFIGTRKEIVTPWSTNATEIAWNVEIGAITRIELFHKVTSQPKYDPMLEMVYDGLNENSLLIEKEPDPILYVEDISNYNQSSGLALSEEEVQYLENYSDKIGRPLTDSELFGFAQINSEHCRHKIFNGEFIIDSKVEEESLFSMIKETSKNAPENIVSAYKDNVAFIEGPSVSQFAPDNLNEGTWFKEQKINSILSLKAETHNFPTTVEPFNGASTGSGGEIRDRMAGGTGSLPLAGTAVYMTAYPRLNEQKREYESVADPRKWKYQTPQEILTKASNGASDFGNKFGQPLITGSLLTFEGKRNFGGGNELCAYDRTIMLAGGVGCAKAEHAQKNTPEPGDVVVLLGGDNYRIGMAGGSVSSVDTGELKRELELSAVQRANPEMQKRVCNVIRGLAESEVNPTVIIHDHGAGGHINCISELLEETGGEIYVDKLPIGDQTLSDREILCNESQERMGLIVKEKDVAALVALANRERSPIYIIGKITGDQKIKFVRSDDEISPVDLDKDFLFGSSPKTIISDERLSVTTAPLHYAITTDEDLLDRIFQVLQLESVGSKDWLTSKVDRSVTGKVATQQCAGSLQLPINDLGVVALDFKGESGIATAIGHAPSVGLLDPEKGSVISIAESLTNIVWAPLERGLDSVALSANWMWPAKQPGENARLYQAVRAASDFAQALHLAIPTGKDSLSMTMKYGEDEVVKAPGTLIISAAGECNDVKRVVTADLKPIVDSSLIHIDLSGMIDNPLGGSAFAQSFGELGIETITVESPDRFIEGFNYIQALIMQDSVLAGHDISAGGVITTLIEMSLASRVGVSLSFFESQLVEYLFTEKPGVVIQVKNELVQSILDGCTERGLVAVCCGEVTGDRFSFSSDSLCFIVGFEELLEVWNKPSFLLDCYQTKNELAESRKANLATRELTFDFKKYPEKLAKQDFLSAVGAHDINAAIVREKGTNGDREMAYSMHLAGFKVKDLTMTDLMEGREDLSDIQFLVFPGGFSNSDVLGAAKGWAGVFKFNQSAKAALDNFYAREDTLSLGVCNGCQLMAELGVIESSNSKTFKMERNKSEKFESSFLSVRVEENDSVMLKSLVGTTLGIWVAHGEGQFIFDGNENDYQIPLKYVSENYPMNPNGSMFNAAGLVSKDGRHLAMMPHLERSIFPWTWGYYPFERKQSDFVTPWGYAFVSAYNWLKG